MPDPLDLENLCREILAAHPKDAAQWRSGKGTGGFFVGLVMRATEGRADPREAFDTLKRVRDEPPPYMSIRVADGAIVEARGLDRRPAWVDAPLGREVVDARCDRTRPGWNGEPPALMSVTSGPVVAMSNTSPAPFATELMPAIPTEPPQRYTIMLDVVCADDAAAKALGQRMLDAAGGQPLCRRIVVRRSE